MGPPFAAAPERRKLLWARMTCPTSWTMDVGTVDGEESSDSVPSSSTSESTSHAVAFPLASRRSLTPLLSRGLMRLASLGACAGSRLPGGAFPVALAALVERVR